jgi:hypothetical protein
MARMSFAQQVALFAEKTGATMDETGRAIALELFTSVVKATPVDTGRARGNWQAGLGSPINTQSFDDENAALGKIGGEVARFGMGSVIFLSNNLPYAAALEFGLYGTGAGATNKTTRDGYSIQAPYGMVRVNVKRIKGRIGRIARNLAKQKGLI